MAKSTLSLEGSKATVLGKEPIKTQPTNKVQLSKELTNLMLPSNNPTSPMKGGPQISVLQPVGYALKIESILDDVFPDGYRVAVYSGETDILVTHSRGFSRKTIDPPEMKAADTDRINVASLSKFITAAAVMKTLQEKTSPLMR